MGAHTVWNCSTCTGRGGDLVLRLEGVHTPESSHPRDRSRGPRTPTLECFGVLAAKVRGDNKTLNARKPPGKRAMVRRYRGRGRHGPRTCACATDGRLSLKGRRYGPT
eukprot:scaffold11380_cov97-Isochrysis_galbana.AAC.3